MATRMQQRRGTAAQWISTNSGNGPILNAGEIGYETDTNKFKIGDGTNHWINLDYFIDANSTVNPAFGSSIVFEGATANAFETTVSVTDPTADRTITLPDASGTVVLADGSGNVTVSGDLTVSGTTTTINSTTINATTGIVFEGLTADAFETTLAITDPTADRTLTLPDSTGTLVTQGYVDTLASNHTSATTNVHGISDTSGLATKTYADAAVTTHKADTIDIHGIANTSLLTTTTNTQTLTNKTLTSPKINEDVVLTATATALNYVSGVTSSIQTQLDNKQNIDANVSSVEIGYLSGVTSDIQTQLNNKQPIVANVSDVEIGYLDGVTSSIQTQLNNKQAIVANVSDTEIGYLDGVTSAIQTQINTKAPTASPTFTGDAVFSGQSVKLSQDIKDYTDSTGSAGKIFARSSGGAQWRTFDDIALDPFNSGSTLPALLDAKLALAGGTMTGALTLSGAPSSDLHAATKLYVDNVTAGINFHEAVHAASTINISANYSNGTSGVGATLTADTNRAFSTLDGESVTIGQRVLIKNQTDAKQNGIYTLTTVGSVSVPWVLTRATDADNNPTGEMKVGDFVLVLNGTTQASIGYINNSATNPIVIGTDNISYTEFSAGKTVVAGNGLQEATPGTLSIDTLVTATKDSVDLKAPIDAPTFTGLVTVAASGVAFTDGTQTKEGVPSQTLIIQKTASYTLSSLTERDDLIEMASGSAMTLTIPADSTLNFPIGTSLDVLQTSTGQVTIAGAGGVTVNATPGLNLRTQWSSATLFKRAANTWVVFGDLTA